MMVINELTHELLITATQKGLIKVWDPMFSEHSHEIQNSPKLITASYLLNDVSRIPVPCKEEETLYRYLYFLNLKFFFKMGPILWQNYLLWKCSFVSFMGRVG